MSKEFATLSQVLPLQGIRFVRQGASRVGDRLGELLVQQGAELLQGTAGGAVEAPDVCIDDTGTAAAMPAALPPGLVLLQYTDFPRAHPRWRPTSCLEDELIHAELGFNRMGSGEFAPEPLALASAYGAMWGAICIGAALLRRRWSRRGGRVVLPLFSAVLTAHGRSLVALDDPALIDVLKLPHLLLAEIFECKDGRYVQNHGTYPGFVDAFLKACGHWEWREEAQKALVSLPDKAAEAAWRARLAEVFKRRTAQEWEESINALGGACTVSRTHREWVAEGHARQARIIVADQERVGMGPAVRVFAEPATASKGGEIALPSTPLRSADSALPLSGVRVIDFAIILAGPTCARTLAELGADVIKIDARTRPFSPYGWLDVNRGKRSIVIDLKQPRGREIALRLIASAEVMVENLRAGKMEQLGLGFTDVLKVQPRIVYASLNAFDVGGPWGERAGWEHSAQAATGMQAARAVDGVPKMVPAPVNDYGTGLLGAYGVLLGLMQARSTGKPVRIAGSLSRTGSFIQTRELLAAGRGEVPGRNERIRTFRCSDGWVSALATDAAAAARAERLVSERGGLGCQAVLDGCGPGDPVMVMEQTLAGLAADRILDDAGLRVSWQHAAWGTVRQAAVTADTPVHLMRPCWPAPDPGEQAAAILQEAGYSETEIGSLVRDRVVYERIPLFSSQ